MTLVEFLLARIEEDEATANTVSSKPPWTIAEDYKTWLIWSAHDGALCMSIWDVDAQHVVRWNPDRVLAECAAKRRIIELHEIVSEPRLVFSDQRQPSGIGQVIVDGPIEYACLVCDDPELGHFGYHPEDGCATLRFLAAPYASHPGFVPAWLVA